MRFGKYNIYIGIVVVTLLLLQIFLATGLNNKLKESTLLLISEQKERNFENNLLKRSIQNIYSTSWLIKQKKEIVSNNLDISKSLIDGDKVFCLIKYKMCNSCVLSVIQDLSILGKEIGNDRIILLTDRKTVKDRFNLASNGFKILEVDTLQLPIENSIVSPLIFILNKQLDIIVPYSSEWYPELYEVYFRKVLPSHFK
ncbi:MAG: hypothetical protein Q8T08_16620 [Ignavibacteria bacterium]|nr:hypothetical protein [Ignavibacteria bacterium]